MPARTTIIRVSALASLGAAAFVFAQQEGVFARDASAPVERVVLSADRPPAAPAVPMPPETPRQVRLPAPDESARPALQTAATIPRPAPATPPSVADIATPLAQAQSPAPAPAEATLPDRNAFGLPCGLEVFGEALPGAMIALDISAPCRPGMRVEISHADLTVADRTDAMGLLTLDVPAFETPAFFTVRLEDGTEEVAMAGVPDLGEIGRVAVSWIEDREIELHAFEDGAAFGEPGHVWQESPGGVASFVAGSGGVLTVLGDAELPGPMMAQVYSYPRDLQAGLTFSVDIPVTETSCGEPLSATAHQLGRDGTTTSRGISLVLPGCDAVGDYLLLQNLFGDRRLAAN